MQVFVQVHLKTCVLVKSVWVCWWGKICPSTILWRNFRYIAVELSVFTIAQLKELSFICYFLGLYLEIKPDRSAFSELVVYEFWLAQDWLVIKLLLVKLFVIKVDQKVEWSQVVLLSLLILVTLITNAVFSVTPLLMHIITGHHQYFKSLIIGV